MKHNVLTPHFMLFYCICPLPGEELNKVWRNMVLRVDVLFCQKQVPGRVVCGEST